MPSPCCRPSRRSRPCAAWPRPARPRSRCSASATRCSTAIRPSGRGRPSGPSSRARSRPARRRRGSASPAWSSSAAASQPVATRSGRADLEHLRAQVPLHDTADELCAVAKDLQARPRRHPARRQGHRDDDQAAERRGQLANYRVRALRHPRHARRRDRRHQRAGPDPHAARASRPSWTTATSRPPRSPPSSSTPTG